MVKLVIAISGDAGERLEKHDLSDVGLTIGRGWNCDVILQDRRVDPTHLRLSLNADGDVVAEDLSSLNGTRVRGKQIDVTTKVGSGVSVYLGKTRLQMFVADHKVRPALSPSIWEQLREIVSAPRWVTAITLVSLIGLVRLGYLQTTSSYELQQALDTLFYAVGLAGIWAVAWGLLGRILRNESHILAHWSVALAAGLIGALLAELVVFFRLDHPLGSSAPAVVDTVAISSLLRSSFDHPEFYNTSATLDQARDCRITWDVAVDRSVRDACAAR